MSFALYKKNAKRGIINIFTKKVIIPAIYDAIEEWHKMDTWSGLSYFFVHSDNHTGVFDEEGNEIVPVIYEEVLRTYSPDMLPPYLTSGIHIYPAFKVRLHNSWGLIGYAGEEIVAPIYDAIIVISGLIGLKKNGVWTIAETYYKYENYSPYSNIINSSNEIYFDNESESNKTKFLEFIKSQAMQLSSISVKEPLFSFACDQIKIDFSYQKFYIVQQANKFGAIFRNGDVALPIIYDFIKIPFTIPVSLFIVKNQGKYGVVDSTNKEILPIVYNQITINTPGTIVAGLNEKYGIYSSEGQKLTEIIYDEFRLDSYSEFIQLKRNNKWIIFNAQGTSTISNAFDSPFDSIRLLIEDDFEDDTEEDLEDDIEDDFEDNFDQDSLFKVLNITTKNGVINAEGNEIIPLIYDEIYLKNNIIFTLSSNGTEQQFDITGNVLPLQNSEQTTQ